MASVKVILRKNRLNNKGLAPLYLRITKNRKTKLISLGIYVKPAEWNEETFKVKKSNSNSTRFNAYIAHKIAEAEGVAVDLETKNKSVNAYKIKEKIIGKPSVDFFPYADKQISYFDKNNKIGSYRRYKCNIDKLKTYCDNKPLFFDDITVTFLKQYEDYLRSKLGNKVNTIHGNMRVIRKIINDAVREDIITRNDNPFYKYTLKSEKTKREFLTEDELKIIDDCILPENQLIFHHRNAYVFATYAGGIRISDILLLKWENFDGSHITLNMQKTQNPVSIKLPKRALQIIQYYIPAKPKTKDFIFPFLRSDVNYSDARLLHKALSSNTTLANKSLKALEEKLKLNKHISFHTSRHTFATLALKKGVRIEYVSKLLGHNDIATTQIYAKIVNADLDKAMDVFNE